MRPLRTWRDGLLGVGAVSMVHAGARAAECTTSGRTLAGNPPHARLRGEHRTADAERRARFQFAAVGVCLRARTGSNAGNVQQQDDHSGVDGVRSDSTLKVIMRPNSGTVKQLTSGVRHGTWMMAPPYVGLYAQGQRGLRRTSGSSVRSLDSGAIGRQRLFITPQACLTNLSFDSRKSEGFAAILG